MTVYLPPLVEWESDDQPKKSRVIASFADNYHPKKNKHLGSTVQRKDPTKYHCLVFGSSRWGLPYDQSTNQQVTVGEWTPGIGMKDLKCIEMLFSSKAAGTNNKKTVDVTASNHTCK